MIEKDSYVLNEIRLWGLLEHAKDFQCGDEAQANILAQRNDRENNTLSDCHREPNVALETVSFQLESDKANEKYLQRHRSLNMFLARRSRSNDWLRR